MQGLVSNGQQEKKVTFPVNPSPRSTPAPNPTFFTDFLPTRAISCFVSSMGRSYLYLNVSKAEGLFIAYSSRVTDWLLPILGNKTTLNDIHYSTSLTKRGDFLLLFILREADFKLLKQPPIQIRRTAHLRKWRSFQAQSSWVAIFIAV